MTGNFHEPRSVTIIRHVNNYLLSTSVSQEAFADDVKSIYHERIPNPKARVMHFHETGDAHKDMSANAQLLMRVINRRVKFPSDLEEAVVLAMPDDYRHQCISDLAARYDLLAAEIPHADSNDDLANLNCILKETGEAIQSLGPIFADGKVDEKDAPHAKHALKEINEALSALVSMQARITAILPDGNNNNVTSLDVKRG